MIKETVSILVLGTLLAGFYFQTQHLGAVNYNESLAIEVHQYSKISYCDKDNIYYWDCIPCQRTKMHYVSVFYNFLTSAQGYVGYDYVKNRIVVAFRGTQDIVNWLNDADFRKAAYPGCANCQVHSGFLNTYNSVAIAMFKAIKELTAMFPTAKIFVTGHSLGAAVATIAVAEITRNGYKVDTFINFASPRVGNPEFAQWFVSSVKSDAIRVTHYRDPVVHMPMEKDGFQHIANEVFYTNEWSTKYKVCNGNEDPTCSYDYIGFLVGDHTEYIRENTNCN